ncbi:MAG TPA: response regulator [Desulfobacteraceae bacterium]|nr:response regulator [Desulfobacteraceae bacterium]
MSDREKNRFPEEKPTILLVDDEDQFRKTLSKQLSIRGYNVLDVGNGEDAIKIVRHQNPEVVVLDQKMPKMDGIQTLQELKNIRPEVQIIMLTGHGSIESARVTGKYDVFKYLQKPCPIDELIEAIESGRQERGYAMARNEISVIAKKSFKDWFIGVQNARPGIIIIGALIFATMFFLPPSDRLKLLLTTQKGSAAEEVILGYSEYRKMTPGQTVTEYYAERAGLYQTEKTIDGGKIKVPVGVDGVARRAHVMIGTLIVAALFWATGAVPVGVTALLVGVLMYFFGILPPDGVARAYAKDAVIFIFGVLALASAISKTGLDRRIGIILLSSSTSLIKMSLIFAPMLAVTASFLSEHALIAFIAPIFMMVYMGAIKVSGVSKDKALVVMMMLTLNYSANVGGPGSPAAGGRNAIMIGILSDYNISITFGQWVQYGLPFVPVMAVIIGLYFYLVMRKKIKIKELNISAAVKREAQKIGKMTPAEYKTAIVLVLLIFMWSAFSSRYGMGGPVIMALVALNILGILRWKDVNSIHWDVVALYAAASAMGTGLAITGAALLIADTFVRVLPEFLVHSAAGLSIATSIFTGVLTNFMSDGATVAAIGPICVPMATIAGASPVMVGLATAFASSFAHMLIIGTPNNAIIFALAKDYETGEQLVTMKDFFTHGAAVLLLSLIVLWFWVILGYWRFMSFPA